VTEPVLAALGIRTYIPRDPEKFSDILKGALILAEDSKKPVAVLLTRDIVGVK
jgi:sulfopyruvate decarboxylase TPP-binding subunit